MSCEWLSARYRLATKDSYDSSHSSSNYSLEIVGNAKRKLTIVNVPKDNQSSYSFFFFLVCICKLYFASKIAPNDSYCPYPFPCVIPSPRVWPGKVDGMSPQRWDYQVCGSYPGCSLSLFLACSLWWKPGALLQAPLWKGPCGKEGLQAIYREDWSPSVQHPARKSILPTATWVSLEVDPPTHTLEPSDGTAALAGSMTAVPWETLS